MNKVIGLCGLAIVMGLCTPGFGQNLLTNGGFETGSLGQPADGWVIWGSGMTDNKVSGPGDSFIHGPEPKTWGNFSYKCGEWQPNDGDAGIYQQVTGINTGVLHTLQFKWAGGDAVLGGIHEIGVADAAVTDGNSGFLVREQKVDLQGQWGIDGWEVIELTFTPSSSTITVYVKTEHDPAPEWDPIATWADDFVLVEGEINQHEIFTICPYIARGNTADTTATIAGTNLDGVDAVRLEQGAEVINGTNISVATDKTSLTVDFPTATEGTIGVTYDLVVSKSEPGVTDQVLQDAFTIIDDSLPILTNSGFETGDLTGWTAWDPGWGGGLATEVSSNGTIWIPDLGGSPDPTYAGTYSLYQHDSGDGTAGVVQSVPVIPGEILRLDWAWGGGDDSDGDPHQAEHQVGLLSGIRGTGDNQYHNLGSVRLDDVGMTFGWETDFMLVEIPDGVCDITVDLRSWHAFESNIIGTYFDDVTLAVDPGCDPQHTTASIAPTGGDTLGGFDLEIFGTRLDLVTGIILDQGGTWVQPDSWIVTDADTRIVATFLDPGPGGFPAGTYDVLTLQEDCVTKRLLGAFTFGCQEPSSLSGVVFDEGTPLTKPQSTVTATISGTAVASVARHTLVWDQPLRPDPQDRAPYWVPEVEIVGTVIDDSDPDNVIVEFDLAGAQAGTYDLVGERDDACGNTNTLDNVLELQLPTTPNLLANGDFELGENGDWMLIPDTSLNGGVTKKGDPIPGPDIDFTQFIGDGDPSNIGYPLVDGVEDPYSGDEVHFAAGGNYLGGLYGFNLETDPPGPDNPGLEFAVWRDPNGGWISQSVGLPSGSGVYELVLAFDMRIWDQNHPHTELVAEILIDDAVASSQTFKFPGFGEASQDGFDQWTSLSIEFVGEATNDITAQFYLKSENDEGGTTSAACAAIVVDNVQLFSASEVCQDPVFDADADGDVDQADFAYLQGCFTGAGFGGELTGACRCIDVPDNGSIDAADVAAFEGCASGPGIPADTTCDDGL